MSEQFFSNGTQFVDCSNDGSGVTLQMLVDMLKASELDAPIRFDHVLISPTVVNGRLCLKLEITDHYEQEDERPVLVITGE